MSRDDAWRRQAPDDGSRVGGHDLDVGIDHPRHGAAVLAVDGELDTHTAAHLVARARAEILRCAVVVLDLAEVRFIGSDGLNALLRLHEEAAGRGCRVRLSGIDRRVARPLALTGLDRVLPVFPTAQAALAHPLD